MPRIEDTPTYTPDLREPARPQDVYAILRRRGAPVRFRVPDEEDVADFKYAGIERLALYWAEHYNWLHSTGHLRVRQNRKRRTAQAAWNAWYREYLRFYYGRLPMSAVTTQAKILLANNDRQPFWPHRYIIDRVMD